MPDKKTDKEWTDRDELAARVFEAMIGGMLASGRGIAPNATPEAKLAYTYADAFLRVREEPTAAS